MKLFRLHTENSNIFKGNVQSSLILPKQSQVALLNMNFEKQDNVTSKEEAKRRIAEMRKNLGL